MDQPPIDFDGAWKEALERYLEPFLALCFPEAHADIDWTQPPHFLDTELQQVAPDEPQGRQHVDKLVRLVRRGGSDAWVLVHVEVQSQRDSDFAQRMFRYHARLFDRYQRQVVSLAVLGDEDAAWQPQHFGYALWGSALTLTFPISKLIALDQAALEGESNLFATIILLHRDAQETRHDLQERLRRKVARYRRLLQQGHPAADVRALLRLLERLLRLPGPFQQQARAAMKHIEEEFAMSYITSFEEFGIAQGRRQEIERSILRTLRVRFGMDAAETIAPRLSRLSLNQLDMLAETALVAASFDAVATIVTELEVEQGRIQGLIDGLVLALEMKFGEVSSLLLEAIRQLTDRAVIEAMMAQVKTAQTLDDVWGALISSSD